MVDPRQCALKQLPWINLLNKFCSRDMDQHASFWLLDLLLQRVKLRCGEKFTERNIQSVAKLFDCGYACAVISAADDIIYGGLCDPAHAAQLIDGNTPHPAQFNDAASNSFTNTHGYHLLIFFEK